MDLFEKGLLTYHDPLAKQRHKSLRQDYANTQKKIISLHYGFRPARPRIETWFNSIFLHGGISHLVGNMIFLWIIGCMIEYGCRWWFLLIIYMLGGVAATGFYWILNSQSLVPAIGASGAISGIMGAFTVFYGFKRVRVFLSLGFYFNYVKFPAIAMLPVWVCNEVFQMIFNQESGVAYAAHIGGLLGGTANAFIACRIPNLLDIEGFEDAQDDPAQPLIEEALDHMGKLEFASARALLISSADHRPEDQAILNHLFTIDYQDPTTHDFHQTSRRLLATLCGQPETFAEALKIYREYIKMAKPARLGNKLYVRLCRVFCDLGKPKDAHHLVAMMIKKCPGLEEIPAILLKLAGIHANHGNQTARRACLNCICNQYPMSNEAGIARRQIEADGAQHR